MGLEEARSRLATEPVIYVLAYNRREYLQWCFEHGYDFQRTDWVFAHGGSWLRAHAEQGCRYMLTPRAADRRDWDAAEAELHRLSAVRVYAPHEATVDEPARRPCTTPCGPHCDAVCHEMHKAVTDRIHLATDHGTYPVEVRRRSLSEMLDYLSRDVVDHAERYTPATLMVLFSTMADQAREMEVKVAEYAAAIDDDLDTDDANVLGMRRERDELLDPTQWRDPDERARHADGLDV